MHNSTKKQKYQSVRLFESPLLELTTHVHPAVPFIMWAPVSVYMLYQSIAVEHMSALQIALAALTGLFVWTFTEYAFHRFAFHHKAESVFGKRLVYIMHGLHHEDPMDPTRLVMPPAPALIYSILLYSFFKMMFGPIWVKPFFGFFLIGYLSYDYIHYYTHHFTPKNPVGRFLKQHHMNHHFVNGDAKWGLSSPLWDLLLGTYDLKKKTKATTNGRDTLATP